MTAVDENQNRRWTFCRPVEPDDPASAEPRFCKLGTLWCTQPHPDHELLALRAVEAERQRSKRELLKWARAESLANLVLGAVALIAIAPLVLLVIALRGAGIDWVTIAAFLLALLVVALTFVGDPRRQSRGRGR